MGLTKKEEKRLAVAFLMMLTVFMVGIGLVVGSITYLLCGGVIPSVVVGLLVPTLMLGGFILYHEWIKPSWKTK